MMQVTKNLFLNEYEILDLFSESTYPLSFNYLENSSRIKKLNFIYLLDQKSFKNFKTKVGIVDDMIIEENEIAANEEEIILNKELLDLERINRLKYLSSNDNILFMNKILKKVDEKEMVFLNEDCFNYILRACPDYEKIKRVIYKTTTGLKIELHTPMVKILFLDNRKVLEKEFNYNNFEKFVLEIPISRFISEIDLSLYLSEIVRENFNQKEEEFQDFKLLIPENFKLELKEIRLLLKSKIENKLLKNKKDFQNEIYDGQIFIFAYNNAILPWEINFKIKEKKSEKIIAIEDDPNKIVCSHCNVVLDNIEQKSFCICGKIFCDDEEKRKERKHECKPKNCEGCSNELVDNNQNILCNCGAIFCKDDCLEENNKYHIKTCFAYKKISKAYETYSWGRMEIEEEKEEILETENDNKIGLNNIGNTCYMNSALQCILHTPIIKKNFLNPSDNLKINKKNPLGTAGDLLTEFKSLTKKYFFTSHSSIRPSSFKTTLSRYLTTFEGYSQHDSQEFCSQLLDSLHEDLNRIRNKPYTQTIEGKKGDNEENLARASWINFLKRNYSFIVENFFGQFRSLLECPKCDHSSLTYDPFQVVSLSIPSVFEEDFVFYLDKSDCEDNLERFEIEVKSLDHFKDISVLELRDSVCEELKLEKGHYEISLFGNKVVGRVLQDFDDLETFYENKEKYYYNRPKIFLTELNSNEIEMKKQEYFNVYLRINHEIFDCSEEVKDSYEFKKKYYYDYDEDKIHTKLTILSKDSKIKNLYENVFRKLYFITSLHEDPDYKKIEKTTEFFERLWEDIVNNQHDKKFFYLKLNDQLLNYTDERSIREIFQNEEKVIIKVFIRISDNTTVKVKLEEFLHTKKNYDLSAIKINSKNLNTYTGKYTLQNLLNNFSNPETLDKNNLWYCSKCKEHVQGKKTLKIYKLPKYLIIHLKKLKMHHQKVPLITFPLDRLKMGDFTINKNSMKNYNPNFEEFYDEKDIEYYKEKKVDLILEGDEEVLGNDYKCFGVVNHYGGQHFGHYTAACRVGGKWCKFDDSSVYDMDEDNVVSDGAYLLFYERI